MSHLVSEPLSTLMTESQNAHEKTSALPTWVWVLIAIIVAIPVVSGLAALVVVVALIAIGNNLESTFERVESEIQQQQMADPLQEHDH